MTEPSISERITDVSTRTISRRSVLRLMGATAAAAAAAAALAPRIAGAQSPAAATAPATPTGVLRLANPGEPNFLDPAMALENYEFSVVRGVYEGLVAWNEDFSDLVPSLATEWSSNDDATEWTFKLLSLIHI